MVHSALLGLPSTSGVSLSTVGTDGRDCESPNPPAGVPKPSKYGVGLRKRRAAILTDGDPDW